MKRFFLSAFFAFLLLTALPAEGRTFVLAAGVSDYENPEIPDLEHQVRYFHGGKPGAIRITDNEFEVFDAPVLYAKSVDGLVFERNKISTNSDYKPFHWNQSRFLLEKVNRAEISE